MSKIREGKMDTIVYRDENMYNAFPDVARTSNGDLVVVFREGKAHVEPTGRVVLIRSTDEGRTWDVSTKVTVCDDALNAQNAAIACLSDGSLIVNICKQECLNPWLEAQGRNWAESQGIISMKFLESWHIKGKGIWVSKSFDNGYTWKENEQAAFDRGGVRDAILELPNETLLMTLYASHQEKRAQSCVLKSRDKGESWGEISVIAYDSCGKINFEEPALVYLPTGKIICMMRVGLAEGYLYQSDSLDDGNSWSPPSKTDIWGYPAHLLRLKSGKILCTYGYRRPPYGIRACLTNDEGKSWDIENEIVIRDDGAGGDLGYPSSVELNDGTVFTVYYFLKEDGIRFIAGSFYHP